MFDLENVVVLVIKNGKLKRSASSAQAAELNCWRLGQLEVSQMGDGTYQLWHKAKAKGGKAILLGILAS